ncbi:unnamed protein product [Brassica rapa subsp. narinosa]
MKTISLMCMAFVILLTSFPAMIKSNKFADACSASLDFCLREIPKNNHHKGRCCEQHTGKQSPPSRSCKLVITTCTYLFFQLKTG